MSVVTATPYAAARLLDEPEAEHEPDAGDHQQPVQTRDVDLPDLRVRRVLDVHARQVAELHRLTRERERARDHRLRRDHRRERRQHDERDQRPRRRESEERMLGRRSRRASTSAPCPK